MTMSQHRSLERMVLLPNCEEKEALSMVSCRWITYR